MQNIKPASRAAAIRMTTTHIALQPTDQASHDQRKHIQTRFSASQPVSQPVSQS